jgi:uncharacterized membrane protein
MRANALACGALFLAAGFHSVRSRRKPHFEKVYVTAGLLLLFGGTHRRRLWAGSAGCDHCPCHDD